MEGFDFAVCSENTNTSVLKGANKSPQDHAHIILARAHVQINASRPNPNLGARLKYVIPRSSAPSPGTGSGW